MRTRSSILLQLACLLAVAQVAHAQHQRSGDLDSNYPLPTPDLDSENVGITMASVSQAIHHHDSDAHDSWIATGAVNQISGHFFDARGPLFGTVDQASWREDGTTSATSRIELLGSVVKQCQDARSCSTRVSDTYKFIEGKVSYVQIITVGGAIIGDVSFENKSEIRFDQNATIVQTGPDAGAALAGAAWICIGVDPLIGVCAGNQIDFVRLSGTISNARATMWKNADNWVYKQAASSGNIHGEFLKGRIWAGVHALNTDVLSWEHTLFEWDGLVLNLNDNGNGQMEFDRTYDTTPR